MFVFDKVAELAQKEEVEPQGGQGSKLEAFNRMFSVLNQPLLFVEVLLPDGTVAHLPPSARDAFSVFEDLCLLANSERAKFLKLESLPKTFALELIESVLTNYHELFRKVCRSYTHVAHVVFNPLFSVLSFWCCCHTIYALYYFGHFPSGHCFHSPFDAHVLFSCS